MGNREKLETRGTSRTRETTVGALIIGEIEVPLELMVYKKSRRTKRTNGTKRIWSGTSCKLWELKVYGNYRTWGTKRERRSGTTS